MGYNIDDQQLKGVVLQAIHGLRRSERVHGLYRQYGAVFLLVKRSSDLDALRYTEAPNWPGLVNVFTKSLSDSTFDEMILLLHPKAPKYQGSIPSCVRTVMYEKIEEIPDRVRAKAAGHLATRGLVDPPPGFSAPEKHPIEPENIDSQEKHSDLPEVALNPNDGEPPVDDGGQEEESTSPEEKRAALTIEAAYYRVMTQKKEVLKGIDATRARLWSLLRNRASSMEWPRHKQYKLLMQGPLVHVLVCLDVVKMFADYINRESKEQLRGGDHRRLEELIERSDWSR